MTTGCSLHCGQCNPPLDRDIEILGYHWKKEKHDSTLPLPLLGLSFNIVDGRALCENTRERKHNIVQELVALKSSTPNEFNLSSIVGKLVFVEKGLCGRAGVHARRPLYQALKDVSTHRQAVVWPAHVLEAIVVCAGTLFSAPPRTLHLDSWQWPSAVLYGDAALSTRRMAAILYIPGKCVKKVFSVQVPRAFLESLSPLGQEDLAINGFEAYWVSRACEHWVEILRSKLVLIFCDNVTAVRGFIHGSSASLAVACVSVFSHRDNFACLSEKAVLATLHFAIFNLSSTYYSRCLPSVMAHFCSVFEATCHRTGFLKRLMFVCAVHLLCFVSSEVTCHRTGFCFI